MVDLGFSLYPERYDVTKSKAYIDLCHSYGAKRLFMSLYSWHQLITRCFIATQSSLLMQIN